MIRFALVQHYGYNHRLKTTHHIVGFEVITAVVIKSTISLLATCTLNGLHGVISQKMILFITTAVRTSNPTIW
jgi:hypothetical protein